MASPKRFTAEEFAEALGWSQPLTLAELHHCFLDRSLFNGWQVLTFKTDPDGFTFDCSRDMDLDELNITFDFRGGFMVDHRPHYIERSYPDGTREFIRPGKPWIHGSEPHTVIADDVEWSVTDGDCHPYILGDQIHGRSHDDPWGVYDFDHHERAPAVALPSDDELYGKAQRDEKGEPYKPGANPTPPARVNHDLEWFKSVNAGMKKLGLDGDEPYPEEVAPERVDYDAMFVPAQGLRYGLRYRHCIECGNPTGASFRVLTCENHTRNTADDYRTFDARAVEYWKRQNINPDTKR